MGKYTFKYILMCMGIYLALSTIEIFAFKPLINLIDTRFTTHLIVYNVFLLIVNPIVTKLIVSKLFKMDESKRQKEAN